MPGLLRKNDSNAGEYGLKSHSQLGPADAFELRLQPFLESRTLWNRLLEEFAGTTLYHRDSWLSLLTTAYRLPLTVATLAERGTVVAAAVFSRTPFSRRFVSLSFSDACPPLSREPGAANRLLRSLVLDSSSNARYEVRGIGGIEDWETADFFVDWQLNLERPTAQLERALALNFRRNLKHAARESIIVTHGNSIELLRRFYVMHLESRRRLGLPPQPWRFFLSLWRIFSADGNLEVWLAQERGKDRASAVFIRDRDVVYYKWGARCDADNSHANHLLFWNAIQHFAACARTMDLGRTDIRNTGLMRFKKELGGTSRPLPYAFYPRAPKRVSAEVLTGVRKRASAIWAQLPIGVTQLLGGAIYRYLG